MKIQIMYQFDSEISREIRIKYIVIFDTDVEFQLVFRVTGFYFILLNSVRAFKCKLFNRFFSSLPNMLEIQNFV